MTARPWYAIGARQLLDGRKAGNVPEGAVSVVLGDSREPAPALLVKPDMPLQRMDWRMLVNLPVFLIASPAVPLRSLLQAARDVAAVRPKRLTVRFLADECHDVDVGHGLHFPGYADIPPVHEFTWAPMDLSLTETGAKLCRALLGEMPMWSTL